MVGAPGSAHWAFSPVSMQVSLTSLGEGLLPSRAMSFPTEILSASPHPTPGSVHTANQRLTWCFPTVRHLGYQPLGSGWWFWRPVSSQRFPLPGPHIFWSFLVGPPTQVQLSPSSWRLTSCREVTGSCCGSSPDRPESRDHKQPHGWTPDFTEDNSSKHGPGS